MAAAPDVLRHSVELVSRLQRKIRDPHCSLERFFDLQLLGEKLGFKYVASGPLVCSSYKAGEFFAARLVRERRLQQPG